MHCTLESTSNRRHVSVELRRLVFLAAARVRLERARERLGLEGGGYKGRDGGVALVERGGSGFSVMGAMLGRSCFYDGKLPRQVGPG